MRVSWLIPFTAGMFVVPTLYGVIGDDARNHIEGLALRLRTQFQANLPPRDDASAPVVKDLAPRPGLQGLQGEGGTANKAEAPVEGRAPVDPTPKADAEVGSPGGMGAPAIQGGKAAPVPGPAPGAERPERNSRDPDALAQDPEKGTSGDRGPSPRVEMAARCKPKSVRRSPIANRAAKGPTRGSCRYSPPGREAGSTGETRS